MQGIPWALMGLTITDTTSSFGKHYKFLWKTHDPYTVVTSSSQGSNPAKTQPISY